MVVVWSCIVVDTQGRVGLKVASTAGLNVGLYGFSVVLLVVVEVEGKVGRGVGVK